LKQKLRVRRTIHHNQLFWLGSFFVLRLYTGKSWPAVVPVFARDDKQRSRFQAACRKIRRSSKKYDSLNLSRQRFDRRIARSRAPKTPSNHRDRFRAMCLQVMNRSEYILLKRSSIEILLARPLRTAETPEVDRQYSKP